MVNRHLRKNPQFDKIIRNQAKYKRLARIGLNITSTMKILKMKKQKWLNFRKNISKIFEHRIFCQSPSPLININKTYSKRVLKNLKDFKFQIRMKRCFHLLYGQKKYKPIKKAFLTTHIVSYNNTWVKLNKINNLFYQFEHRLDVILYRLYFFPTLYASQDFIKHNSLLVNGQNISYLNYLVQPNDLIEINKNREIIYSYLKFFLLNRTKKKPNFFQLINYNHLEVNYNTLMIILIKPLIKSTQLTSFFNFQWNFDLLKFYFTNK